jgi:hypothetical protein
LTTLAIRIGRDKTIECVFRRNTLRQQIEQLGTVLDARSTLRRDRTDASAHPWNGVAHARISRRDGNTSFASPRIDGDDREGVKFERRPPSSGFLSRRGRSESDHSHTGADDGVTNVPSHGP